MKGGGVRDAEQVGGLMNGQGEGRGRRLKGLWPVQLNMSVVVVVVGLCWEGRRMCCWWGCAGVRVIAFLLNSLMEQVLNGLIEQAGQHPNPCGPPPPGPHTTPTTVVWRMWPAITAS